MREEPATSDRSVAKIAARQHGVLTAEQLGLAGLTKDGIHHRVRAGRLHSVHRGVYAVGHARLTFEGRCTAAFLACCSDIAAPDGPDAVVSHVSAGAVWGMHPPEPGPIHISVLSINGRKRRAGIVIHRPPSLCPAQLTRRSGISVTSPARTLRDLRRTGPPELFQKAQRRALDLRLVTEDELGESPDLTRSELERMFLRLCRRRRLPAPEVNTRVAGFEVDFLWQAHSLVVETDGFRHHGHRAAFESDRERDAQLQAKGFLVLRFSYRQVKETPAAVAQAGRTALCR